MEELLKKTNYTFDVIVCFPAKIKVKAHDATEAIALAKASTEFLCMHKKPSEVQLINATPHGSGVLQTWRKSS